MKLATIKAPQLDKDDFEDANLNVILLCYMSNVISEMLLKDIVIYVHCCMIYYQMKGQPISTLLTIIMLNTNKGFVVSHGSRILTLAQVFVLIS